MEVLVNRGIAPQRALETASTLSSALVKPILERIEPYDLGAFSLDNRLALTYCRELSRPENVSLRTQRRSAYKSLVEYYPAHEFAIDVVEAESLRLKVSLPAAELDELFDDFRAKSSGLETYVGLVPASQRNAI